MPFGKSVVEARKQHGWSQAELARRSGVAQPTLQRIEAGIIKAPGVTSARKIARALGVSLESLTPAAPRSSALRHDELATRRAEGKRSRGLGEEFPGQLALLDIVPDVDILKGQMKGVVACLEEIRIALRLGRSETLDHLRRSVSGD